MQLRNIRSAVEQRPVAVALDTGEQTERRIELQSCTEMVCIQIRSLKLNNVSHHLRYMTARYNLLLRRERALGATIEQTQLVWTDKIQHRDQYTGERRRNDKLPNANNVPMNVPQNLITTATVCRVESLQPPSVTSRINAATFPLFKLFIYKLDVLSRY